MKEGKSETVVGVEGGEEGKLLCYHIVLNKDILVSSIVAMSNCNHQSVT